MNEDRELYVDLQLDDWIQPDDDFPVGVTTWKILQEDWWYQSWIILNWKTTSGDYNRLIYANDWNLYIDIGDGEWKLLWWWGWDWFCNVKRFTVNSTSDSTTGQEVIDWILQWKYAILVYNWTTYLLANNSWVDGQRRFISTEILRTHMMSDWYSYLNRTELWLFWDSNNQFDEWQYSNERVTWDIIFANFWYDTPFNPTDPWDPATKKYVDDWLALKQDKLTAWTRITIDPVTNVISADVSGVMTYMWNVTDSSQLPASWNQWDCWYDETAKTLRAWDWNQWNDIGGTGIDLTNYFNMTTNTSDDITEWTTNLFVTQTEKNYWNSKQAQLTAWTNIQIDNNNVISATDTTYTQWDWIEITNQNVINNTAKFDPDNTGSLGQFLKKTNDGYAWADVPWWWGGTSYTAWAWIDITNNVISATDRFTPTNQWSIGQVLKKSGANTYYWANESWGGGWWGWNFNPTNTWTPWQILTKTSSGYAWMDAKSNVKCFDVNFVNPTQAWLKAIADWVDADETNWAIIKTGQQDVFLYSYKETSGNITQYHFFSYRNRTWKTTTANGDFTSLKQVACTLSYNEIEYSISAVDFNTVTNFLVVEDGGYSTPYMPTAWYQPATKAYVDSRNWVGTLSEYNNLPSIDPNVFYNITSLS